MRILHVWDTAGIASILAKYQRRLGHVSHVVIRSGYDRFGITKFYSDTSELSLSSADFIKHVVRISANYDIVHVHDLPKLVFFMKLFRNNKTVVLHYHGSNLRDGGFGKMERIGERLADHVIVATEDLVSCVKYNKNVSHVANPVDTEHFKPVRVTGKRWLVMYDREQFESEIPPFARDNHVAFDRSRSKISYERMPYFLSEFAGYVDIKVVRGERLRAMSTTGLQALACGLQVVDYNNVVHTALGAWHKPENVVLDVSAIYRLAR